MSNHENAEEIAIAHYDSLTSDEQAKYVRSLMYNLDEDLSAEIAKEYLPEECLSEEAIVDSVVDHITFENCNVVMQHMASESPKVAKAMFEELRYWDEAGRFNED